MGATIFYGQAEQVSGGPTVPSGRSGRAATRSRAMRMPMLVEVHDAMDLACGSIWCLSRHGAASCRCATRPVLRTRPGHPKRAYFGSLVQRAAKASVAPCLLSFGTENASVDIVVPRVLREPQGRLKNPERAHWACNRRDFGTIRLHSPDVASAITAHSPCNPPAFDGLENRLSRRGRLGATGCSVGRLRWRGWPTQEIRGSKTNSATGQYSFP